MKEPGGKLIPVFNEVVQRGAVRENLVVQKRSCTCRHRSAPKRDTHSYLGEPVSHDQDESTPSHGLLSQAEWARRDKLVGSGCGKELYVD